MSIAEDIIEGLFCQGCGEYIDSPPPGHPRYCSDDCEADYAPEEKE